MQTLSLTYWTPDEISAQLFSLQSVAFPGLFGVSLASSVLGMTKDLGTVYTVDFGVFFIVVSSFFGSSYPAHHFSAVLAAELLKSLTSPKPVKLQLSA